jgi:hypothetical protein
VLLASLIACAAVTADAQAPGRMATTAGSLLASPFFFHGKQIVVRHQVTTERDLTQLAGTPRPVYVYWRERPTRSEGEIRGEFWDLGRIDEGDSRFAAYDFRPLLEVANQGRWPGRERIFVILGATLLESPLPQTATIRAIALAPETYEGRGVTLVGRFKGRNLYGDLPQGLGKSKWDFVLQSADAAVWVSEIRPRAKDLDLDPGARVDTGKWVEVTGTVRREGDTVWIAGQSIRAAAAPTETPVEIAVPATPKEPPPTVIFSAPVQDDTDVDRSARIRIQFSRDMIGRSFRDAVRVTYATPPQPGAAPLTPPPFTASYNDGLRALEIVFKEPLQRFQLVKVELLEGITAIDRQPLAPWSLTFLTGS